jgi:hypothetical protein
LSRVAAAVARGRQARVQMEAMSHESDVRWYVVEAVQLSFGSNIAESGSSKSDLKVATRHRKMSHLFYLEKAIEFSEPFRLCN